MRSYEQSTILLGTPDQAVAHCVRRMAAAGFKRTTVQGNIITARKRTMGQWTRSDVTITIEPHEQGSLATVTASGTPQSVASVVSPPAQRLVGRIVNLL